MQPRSWLPALKILALTVAALVLADIVGMSIRARSTPAPSTQPITPAAAQSAAPVTTEQQAVEQAKTLLGTHSDVTKETPKPGESGASGEGPEGAPGPAPESVPDPSAQMTLVGTIVSPGASIAIIMAGTSERMVHEGEEVGTPPFKVVEIRDNFVILEMTGVKKTLWMPSFQPPAGAAPQGGLLPPPPAPAQNPPPQYTGDAGTPGKAILAKTDRDKAMADLPTTLKDLRILPNKKNGADYGSKVVFLAPGSFLSKVGLAQDDILLAVNGSPVSNAEQGLQVFQAFQHEERIVMKIDRGGKLIQQEVEFR